MRTISRRTIEENIVELRNILSPIFPEIKDMKDEKLWKTYYELERHFVPWKDPFKSTPTEDPYSTPAHVLKWKDEIRINREEDYERYSD